MTAVYVIIISAVFYRELSVEHLWNSALLTARSSSAILIIALFYSGNLSLPMLAGAGACHSDVAVYDEFEAGMHTPAWELFPYGRSALFEVAGMGHHPTHGEWAQILEAADTQFDLGRVAKGWSLAVLTGDVGRTTFSGNIDLDTV